MTSTPNSRRFPAALIRSLARDLAARTEDAYSFPRYGDWVAVAHSLIFLGYSVKEAEAIIRSKILRWAADEADDGGTCAALVAYVKKNPRLVNDVFAEVGIARRLPIPATKQDKIFALLSDHMGQELALASAKRLAAMTPAEVAALISVVEG